MLIGFVVWSLAALLFFGIGVSSWTAKDAVGFFTFAKPPVVTNVKKYNHSVAILWIVVAVILEIIGVPILFTEQNSPMFIIVIFGVFARTIRFSP